MTKESFIKELNFKIDEELCYNEISNAANSVWISTVATENDGFEFIREKSNSNFFVGKLHRFPKTLLEIQNQNIEFNLEKSYITKCNPRYISTLHIDKGRNSAIIIPIGRNKGEIIFKPADDIEYRHTYTGPTLTKVDIPHGPINTSDSIRYSITLDIPGDYAENYNKKW